MNMDFHLTILFCMAEIGTADVPEHVRELRFAAAKNVQKYLEHYQKLGYLPKLLDRIAEKKCKQILSLTTKEEMDRLSHPRCPYYDGNRFHTDACTIPEEELICWSETSMHAPLNTAGFQRYMEVFQQVLPEESKKLFV